jgi:DNA invertase Pin-like site-specific DNA recombinase
VVKVALYARVSKELARDDGTFQDPENQLRPMRQLAEARGWETEEFIEYAPGGSNRPLFQAVLGRAMQLQFKGILVWSIDRFSREGILETLSYIQRLKERGVWVKSVKEEWLDTDAPSADLMLAMFAWFAKFERDKISQRTKAAIARLKGLGVYRGGRPSKKPPILTVCNKTDDGYICKFCGKRFKDEKRYHRDWAFHVKYAAVNGLPSHDGAAPTKLQSRDSTEAKLPFSPEDMPEPDVEPETPKPVEVSKPLFG